MKVLKVIAIVSLALQAGVYFDTFTASPARSAMSVTAFVQYQQILHSYYGIFMPVLIAVSGITALVWSLSIKPRWRGAEFWLIAASFIAIVSIFAMTRAVNVPLNNWLMTLNADAPPADFRQTWAPWETVNTLRAAFSVSALALEAIALTVASEWRDASRPG